MPVPASRVRRLNDAPLRAGGDHVVYWMTAYRRPTYNFALERAVELAVERAVPLIVFEPLRAGYEHASDRIHRFVIDGMRDHAAFFADRRVAYFPYVEPAPGAGRGLLESLAARAAAVVTDDWPCFFVPAMQRAAAARLDVRLEAVDAAGLVPIRRAERAFARAFDFRRWLHQVLPDELERWPRPDPTDDDRLRGAPAVEPLAAGWPAASAALLEGDAAALAALPIDHAVAPVDDAGGFLAARARLTRFVDERLERYLERAHPDEEVASRLSPYLHFGHVGTHEVLHAIAEREGWSPAEVSPGARGGRTGFWRTSEAAEGFLDQIVTWRELGFNALVEMDDPLSFDSLPSWAKATLAKHSTDAREPYDFEQLERAETDDEVWNAAQRQLLEEGHIQSYLRMLWGKKLLQWAPTPRVALEQMIRLNDRYAIDGRDPNSYSGIFWVLGRYDRAWGPERKIFGTVRCMTSDSAKRKLRMKRYLARWSAPSGTLALPL